jgi:hypothetical protein
MIDFRDTGTEVTRKGLCYKSQMTFVEIEVMTLNIVIVPK